MKITDSFYGNKVTTIDSIVSAILSEKHDYGAGELEKLKTNTETLSYFLKKLPEDLQRDFINKFSNRFRAEEED